jgi:D-alanyl-D-alanine carboxypeptidase
MSLRHVLPGPCLAGVGLLAILTFAGGDWNRAQARATPGHAAHPAHDAKGTAHEAHKGGRHGVLHGSNYHPPYAAIVVDDNTDQTIYEVNADEPRHPASLTKIMTLYMLFEQLEAGKLKLDTPLPVSAHAAGMAPVKLGLKAGQTIPVEDALKAMVTKSANDAAAVAAEAIGGGDEAEGARLMTAKARALGMSGTTYVNGSGLPAEEQITTARDQALLGLIIHNRFPNYYTYFSTLSFNYHGREMHNHNGLLGNVKGVDGIKTGYTEASGYNLVASVTRDDRHIVSVVLGGTSNGQRDNLMRKLIEEHILRASAQRVAPAITEVASANGALANPIAPAPGMASAAPPPAAAPALASAPAPASAPALASAPASARVPAPALASVPAATAVATPAIAPSVESANPVVSAAPAAATLAALPRASFDPAFKADRKHGHRPNGAASKPKDPRLPAQVPAQPGQAQAPKPVATAAHVAHPRPASAAGGQPRQIPAKPSVP